jgi:hypothetical protein
MDMQDTTFGPLGRQCLLLPSSAVFIIDEKAHTFSIVVACLQICGWVIGHFFIDQTGSFFKILSSLYFVVEEMRMLSMIVQ